jgi:hypothetical protein
MPAIRPASAGFYCLVNYCFGSLAASDLRIHFVGLPDKLHFKQFDRLQMLSNIHPTPPDSKVLGAYATPNLSTLMSLFKLLFSLTFKASKA